MKKFLAIIISVFLLFGIAGCSNDTPSVPPAQEEVPSELDKVNEKIESASEAFYDVQPVTNEQGDAVYTVKNVEQDGYTITNGQKTVSEDGLSTSTDMTITYEEDGKTVEIMDRQSASLSVTAEDGSELEMDPQEKAEIAETAISQAREIPAGSFRSIGDNKYEYTPISAYSRAAGQEGINRIVIEFTYEDYKASYTYTVTYVTDGNTLTVTSEMSKETRKTVDDVEDTSIADDLMKDFSLGSLQSDGNEFYVNEAKAVLLQFLPQLGTVLRVGDFSDSESYTAESSLTVKSPSGKLLLELEVSSESTHVTEMEGGYEDTENIVVDIINADPSFGIPFIVKGGSIEITTSYVSSFDADQHNVSTDNTSVVFMDPSGSELLRVESENTSTTEFEDSVTYYVDNGSVKITYAQDVVFEAVTGATSTTTVESVEIDENGNETRVESYEEKSTTEITTLNLPEGISLSLIRQGSTVETTANTTTTFEFDGGEKVNENSTTTSSMIIDGEETDPSALIGELMSAFSGQIEGIVSIVNGGFSFSADSSETHYSTDFEYILADGSTEYLPVAKQVNVSSGTAVVKAGIVDKISDIIAAFGGSETDFLSVMQNIFLSMDMENGGDYEFEEPFYGSQKISARISSTPWGMKGASITFHDGYMKGTYEFSADELMMYPEMY